MKHLSLISASIVLLLLTHTSCKKITGCEEKGSYSKFRFELPVKLYPAKDTFNIGDTIWIEQSFSDYLINKETNNVHQLKDFDFKPRISIYDLNTTFPAKPHPNPYYIIYTEAQYSKTPYITYEYKDNFYYYKAALIVNQKGFFGIFFSSSINGYDLDFSRCRNEKVYVEMPLNNNTNNNYEMLQYSADEHYASLTEEEFKEAGGYCFYVK